MTGLLPRIPLHVACEGRAGTQETVKASLQGELSTAQAD
jgi:hypothetical protein